MATILVVEDEPVILRVVSELLRDSGHKVATAVNGKEAMKLARGAHFDLVITDLVMPEKEGIETIMDLRRQSPTTKIIAMSGGGRGSAEVYLALAERLGASRTLAKPLSREEMLEAVADVLAEEKVVPMLHSAPGAGGGHLNPGH